jgi:HYR domain/WD40-like Beta Propeller Repeat
MLYLTTQIRRSRGSRARQACIPALAGAVLLLLTLLPNVARADTGTIYYVQQGPKPSSLMAVQPDGAALRDISPSSLEGNGSFLFPSASPAGGSMAFLFSPPKDPPQLWISQVDGSDARQVPWPLTPWGKASWSPGGQHFALIGLAEDSGVIFVASRDGNELTRLPIPQTSPLGSVIGAHDPVWSPDGNQIAYLLQILRPNGHTAWEVRTHSLIGPDDRHLYLSPDWSNFGWDVRDLWDWSPDGQWLLVTTNGTFGDRVRRLATDQSETIELLGPDDNGQGYSGASFSPEGTRLAYSRYTPQLGLTYFLYAGESGTSDATRVTAQVNYTEEWPDWASSPPDGALALQGLPEDIAVDATGPSGAVVTYVPPTAIDGGGEMLSVACDPQSSSTFPIGTTTVFCTATEPDNPNNSVSGSFAVRVRGTAEQLENLADVVEGIGPGGSLANKIASIQKQLDEGNIDDACGTLRAFVRQVESQADKHIAAGPAATLIASAQRIQQVVPCTS